MSQQQLLDESWKRYVSQHQNESEKIIEEAWKHLRLRYAFTNSLLDNPYLCYPNYPLSPFLERKPEMNVYEYVIIYSEKSQCCSATECNGDLLLLTPRPIMCVADNREVVRQRAIHGLHLSEGQNIDNVEVLVRPFVH